MLPIGTSSLYLLAIPVGIIALVMAVFEIRNPEKKHRAIYVWMTMFVMDVIAAILTFLGK